MAGLVDRASWFRLQETTRVTASITLATQLRLDVYARSRGISRSAAINEAISVRMIVWEQRMARDQRLKVDQLFREADNWAPLDDLLASAKQPWEDAG